MTVARTSVSSGSLELADESAVCLRGLLARREVSATEVMSAVATRIESRDTDVNAFASLDLDRALSEARSADRHPEPAQALRGIPVTIKDLTSTVQFPTQHGSAVHRGEVPPADAPVVRRLRSAGAIVIGKTTVPELGWCAVSGSPLTGDTHNPHRIGCTAGGSSSGAAAAAAAGFGPLHQGTDGAGSVRLPAHFCGVVGFKPTYGLVAQAPVGVGDNTSHTGPIARTVADCALMLDVMRGMDPADHTSVPGPSESYLASLDSPATPVRIAYSADLGHARVDPEVAALTLVATQRLADAVNAELVEIQPPWGPAGPDLARFFWAAHTTSVLHLLPAWRDQMDPGLVALIEDGARYTLAQYQDHRALKYRYCGEVNATLAEFDVLATPAASVTAFPVGQLRPDGWPAHPWDWFGWAEFSYPFNFTGSPAISVPCAVDATGLPVGLQIAGRRFDDAAVLQLAAVMEEIA